MANVAYLRRFDADLSRVQEETRQERALKEKVVRERDMSVSERLHLEQELEVGFLTGFSCTRCVVILPKA